MHIEHIVNEGGDWVVLRVDGKDFYSGHSIPDFAWMDLITKISPNILTECKEVSDEDMEEGNY